MRTYKKQYRQVPDKIICDVCGSNCTDDNCGTECAFIDALWGYCSKKDGSKFDIQICEVCFDSTIEYLRNRHKALNYCPIEDGLSEKIKVVECVEA